MEKQEELRRKREIRRNIEKRKEDRISKINFYINIAKEVARRSPCISRRQFGAILVKDEVIISTGYAGTVRGVINCGIDCECLKDKYNEPSEKSYNNCPSVHAEMNVVINAARSGVSTINSTLYLGCINNTGNYKLDNEPCFLCRRVLIQAGIKDCYYTEGKKEEIKRVQINVWLGKERRWIESKFG